jgi:8-oxo-dGTP pyrophosphatase MutT (NUDIX family)
VPSAIRVIAVCVFRDGGRVLVSEGVDRRTGRRFARPLGGGVEPGETSRQAVAREIREELGQDVTDLRLLGVLESIFEYEGEPGHQVVFVYDGRFADASVYRLPELPLREPGWVSPAVWRRVDAFGDVCQLVPDGLLALLSSGA